jgi:hypothetical protein
LEDIQTLQRDAKQSGLIKEQSELDKINEKYDLAIQKIQQFNAERAKESPATRNQVAAITAADIEKANNARAIELTNTRLKQEADAYIKNLEVQKDIFERYEDAKKSIGIEKADEMFAGQTKGFATYIDFLQNEATRLISKMFTGTATIGDQQKLIGISKDLVAANKKARDDDYNQQLADYKRLFDATATFNQRRRALEVQYQKDLAALRKNFKGPELEAQEAALKASHEDEVKELENSLTRQSALYRKLNTDIIGFTRDQVKGYVAELKKIKSDGFFTDKEGRKTFLTPEMMSNLTGVIEGAENLLASTNKTAIAATKISTGFKTVASLTQELATSLEPFNKQLADAVAQMSSLANIGASAAASIAAFASGDIAGGVSGATQAITAMITMFSRAREENRKVREEVASFTQQLFQGELDINAIYRDRARLEQERVAIGIKGINAQNALLSAQRKQVEDDITSLMAKIANETFTLSEEEKKKRGLGVGFLLGAVGLLAGSHSQLSTVTESLAGKSFADLEKLFNSGQLSDKAKELFLQLQKLKQEGVDIDRMLEENKVKVQELFAGTTAQSLVDSIADGFNQGFRSVQDFAGKTEDIIRGAMLSALKFQILEEPLKALFAKFAADAESGGGLDTSESC